MLRKLLAGAMALSMSVTVSAQESAPRVWLDLDRGPIILELDEVNAPITTGNFLDLVAEGHYDGLIFHRNVPGFVIQAGAFDRNFNFRESPFGTITGEPENGLSNVPGTIAMALAGGDVDSATSQFYINVSDNSSNLDGTYTVFGEVVYGSSVVEEVNQGTIASQSLVGNSRVLDLPVTPAVIQRAVQIEGDGFPIMPLHTGSWFVPATSGTGLNVEIANDASSDEGPLLLAYWYDFRDGQQQWLFGFGSFEYGDTEVTLNMRTFDGEGGDFQQPPPQDTREDWGTLTVSFTDCENGVFSYQSESEGSGELNVKRLTIPDQKSCLSL